MVALHIWFIVCITFIFLALLELAAALIYCQKIQDSKDSKEDEKKQVEGCKKKSSDTSVESLPPTPAICENGHGLHQQAVPSVSLDLTTINNNNNKNHQHNRFQPHNKTYSNLLPLPEKYRRHSYHFSKFGPNDNLSNDAEKPSLRKGSHSHSSAANLLQSVLNQVYGEIDWRKSPQVRNKVDYVARILFPSTFALFVFFYFFILHYR